MKQLDLVFPRWFLLKSFGLSYQCFVFLAEMANLADANGAITFSLEEMADMTGVKTSTIRNYLILLSDAGCIRQLTQQERVQRLIDKREWSDGNGNGAYQCVWCHCFTTTIHHHHHPIPKCQGGTEIVEICANCHAEFHTDHHTYFITVPFWNDWFSKIQEQEERSNELSL